MKKSHFWLGILIGLIALSWASKGIRRDDIRANSVRGKSLNLIRLFREFAVLNRKIRMPPYKE